MQSVFFIAKIVLENIETLFTAAINQFCDSRLIDI
jgi:hypothetical protein